MTNETKINSEIIKFEDELISLFKKYSTVDAETLIMSCVSISVIMAFVNLSPNLGMKTVNEAVEIGKRVGKAKWMEAQDGKSEV